MKQFFLFIALILFVRVSASAQCGPATAKDFLDINNVKALILNGGDLWWDLKNNAEYEVPKGGGVSSLFAGALWIGGLDAGGNLHLAAQTYRQNGNDFFPGPLDQNGQVILNGCTQFDHLWKINQSTIDSFNANLFASIPESILDWPGKGNPNNSTPNQDLAPFIDVNADGIYNPADGDYPKIKGDQAIWWVFNDVGNIHGESGGAPLGVEVQAMAFAFKANHGLNNTTFYNYKIINKSATNLNSVRLGWWTDPDLGCYVNDYMGTNPDRNMAIVYNATADDGSGACQKSYGTHPPLVGLHIVQLPLDNDGHKIAFNSEMIYNNDFSVTGNPENAADYWSYLNGRWKDDSPLTFGGNGYGGSTPTKYIYPDSPWLPDGWSECALNNPLLDQRIVMSMGPMSLYAGDTREFTLDVLWYRPSSGNSSCASFSPIEALSDSVQNFYDRYEGLTDAGSPQINSYSFEIFPNPVKENFTLKFSDDQSKQIVMKDIFGKTVMNVSDFKNDLLTINAKQFSTGIYFIEVKTGSGSASSRKLVIQ